MTIITALNKYFGYDSFRPGQEEIINSILNNKSIVAVLPTGAGKSLCYQLPALISENFSIVISPLIALMKDQVDSLNRENEIAAFINSTMSYTEAEEVINKISYGQIKLLYLAPERLESKKFADKLLNLNPNFLFVDEAHCISEWGHNFRPSYTKIRDFIDYCSIKKISAFTATATPEVVQDIIVQLKLKEPQVFVKGFERENLHLNVELNVSKKAKTFELLFNIKGPAIVYTSSRKKAEEVSEYLLMKGINSAYYHAGLNPIERRKIQDEFISGKLRVICATNAFGMGIDKKDIRLIIHYNTPSSIENYYQEIGRAGRDGKESFIYLLYDERDIPIQNYFISSSHPKKELIQKVYDAINDFNQVAAGNQPENELIIDTEYISNYTGTSVSRGLLHASLKFLENAGYLKQISEFDKKDTLFIPTNKQKLKKFIQRTSNEELKNILLLLLRDYGNEIFSHPVKISIPAFASSLGLAVESLRSLLATLDNLGIIVFKQSIEKETVLLTSPRIESGRLKINYKKLNESFLNANKKLDKMIDFVFTKECRFKYILNYFGENLNTYNCGKCDNCTTSQKISDSASEYLSELILKTLAEADSPLPESSLVKILTGGREKESYSKFGTFGSGANYSKSEIILVLHNLILQKLVDRLSGKHRLVEISSKGLNSIKDIFSPEASQPDYEKDLYLYNILREIRKQASEKFLQTPYLLCPDAVLRKVAKEKPKTRAALLSIEGFNTRMFNKIGMEFLEAIEHTPKETEQLTQSRELPKNIKATYDLLLKKYDLKEIAQLRKLSEAVISMQIETIVEYYPDCDIEYLFGKDKLNLIRKELEKGYSTLKELKERLPGDVTYAQIRIAVAKYKYGK